MKQMLGKGESRRQNGELLSVSICATWRVVMLFATHSCVPFHKGDDCTVYPTTIVTLPIGAMWEGYLKVIKWNESSHHSQ